MNLVGYIVSLGIMATLVMDLWALVQRYLFGIHSLNYALVGRWLGLMRYGQFCHQTILSAQPVKFELILGWLLHYLIGIVFATVFVLFCGQQWLLNPTLWPALLFGLLTVVVPFFIMQPAFGFGIAASQTVVPNTARVRSIVSHLSFGFGLFVAGLILHLCVR